jgi:hypothetical protein
LPGEASPLRWSGSSLSFSWEVCGEVCGEGCGFSGAQCCLCGIDGGETGGDKLVCGC